MIERLVLARPHLGGDRLVPFLGIVEHRIDVEYDTAERIKPVPHHLADLVLRVSNLFHHSTHFSPLPRWSGNDYAAPWDTGLGSYVIVRSAASFRDPSRPQSRLGRPAPWPVSRSHRPAFCRRSS